MKVCGVDSCGLGQIYAPSGRKHLYLRTLCGRKRASTGAHAAAAAGFESSDGGSYCHCERFCLAATAGMFPPTSALVSETAGTACIPLMSLL